MEFKRPEGTLYPIIHSTFKVKAEGSKEEFYIQDLTENFFDAAVDFIVANHARGAVFHRAAKTLATEEGVAKVSNMYRNVFKGKISLICLKMGTNEIAGLNALYVKSKDDVVLPDESNDEAFKRLNEGTGFINSSFDVMEHYKVDRVMYAAGLCVDQKFRGRGIATEILKARVPLMQAIGVNVTSSIFSTVGAQKAAISAGYDENWLMGYEELQEKLPQLDFSHAFKNSCKVLSLKI